jgi:hypothetical protein
LGSQQQSKQQRAATLETAETFTTARTQEKPSAATTSATAEPEATAGLLWYANKGGDVCSTRGSYTNNSSVASNFASREVSKMSSFFKK